MINNTNKPSLTPKGELTLNNHDFAMFLSWVLNKKGKSGIKIQCHGNSMTPFIRHGDSVIVRAIDAGKKIKPGDIVAVAGSNRTNLIIHRVISTRKGLIQTKGDNAITPDGWFPRASILGIVTPVPGKFSKKSPLHIFTHFFNRHEFNFMVAFCSRIGILNGVINGVRLGLLVLLVKF